MSKKKIKFREVKVEALFEGLRIMAGKKFFLVPVTETIIKVEKGPFVTYVQTENEEGAKSSWHLYTKDTVKVVTK